MKKYILASLLCALSALGTTATLAQSASSANASQTETATNRLAASPSSSYEGMWQGTLRTPEGLRRVILDVTRRPDGSGLMGSMVTSAQTPFSVLVDTFATQDRHVRLDMKTANSAFEGVSNRSLTEIKGTWTREGKSLALTLKRMELTPRDSKATVYGMQAQIAASSRKDDPENPSSPYEQRRTPAFRIAPPRWFSWYEWTPRIGNQETPYGTYYW